MSFPPNLGGKKRCRSRLAPQITEANLLPCDPELSNLSTSILRGPSLSESDGPTSSLFGGIYYTTSWWFFTNPFEKYAEVKLDHFPR